MPICYIIFSPSLDKYYIGSTQHEFQVRLNQHISALYSKSFTKRAKDWEPYLIIPCQSISQARKIELYIKRMKNKKYITSLKSYPELVTKLIARFS
ncbi:MAG: GIY-YIG nuclease family protein [Cyclobacteriaceae bacterium]|nr:GIY-YIG nuclease family protein [Cyclobacteriaceae bacterium]